ncbi:glycoside hydrolase family 2 protein [Opacimonas viscosa]|uniref:Glycoside hydrolase family 2 protein n=1 Tax=Opacimonas viscosa TaxID=2961944 RepID=A0AA41X140_9ALTE|nr:glycoside hydrolase family 2 TIM barrel-domain containing protein [Opacimonas viscosa]MCP3427566.1 glycoside hydrolase family 2 protein [Opacimonas viscosa]
MRAIAFFAISLFTLAACQQDKIKVPSQTIAESAPAIVSLNQDWQFQRSEYLQDSIEPSDSKWQIVQLPHTPKVEPLLVNEQWQGIALYRKSMDLSAYSNKQNLFVKFEGAMNVAEVWINDTYLGKHLGGYLPFQFDISNYAGQSNVELKVKLNNLDNWVTGPKPMHLLDFNTYGGLYRDVNLIVEGPVYITDPVYVNEAASGGIFVTTESIDKNEAKIKVRTHIQNSSPTEQPIELVQELWFDGQRVSITSKSLSLDATNAKQHEQEITVNNARLWHPDHPHLYTLKTQIRQQDQILDVDSTRIGIRQFTFNEKHELLINGEVTFLRGVNRHQEYPHLGYATSPNADYRDAVKIKSAGFDYVRLSHYPHSKAFMDAADELGLVLVDAILGWQYYSPFPEFQQQIFQTCRDLLRRDRNHASVLAWECSLNESWMPEDFISELDGIVEAEYPGAFSAGWQPEYDIYLQARQHRMQHYEEPTQPYNVSEYGDWEYYAQNAGLNQDAWGNLKEEERTSRQLLGSGEKRLLQQATNVQEAHNDNLSTPAYSDGYWVMFDYNRGYADDLEASGISSIYRLPKYSYYFFQSQRSPKIVSSQYESGPMVFIASDWKVGSSNKVRVFSNSQKVELYLNGQLVGSNTPTIDSISKHLAHPPFYFSVPEFEAGELVAKAYIDDKLVATHKVVTPSDSSQVKLHIDTAGKPIVENDVVFVHAELLDIQGNPSLENGVEVNFVVSGGAEVVNPGPIVTKRGFASALIKLKRGFTGGSIRAQVTGNPAMTAEIKL